MFQFKEDKERGEKDLLHADLDFDKCGLAAAQTMAGEDPGKLARTAQQHAQVSLFPLSKATNPAAFPGCLLRLFLLFSSGIFSSLGVRVEELDSFCFAPQQEKVCGYLLYTEQPSTPEHKAFPLFCTASVDTATCGSA